VLKSLADNLEIWMQRTTQLGPLCLLSGISIIEFMSNKSSKRNNWNPSDDHSGSSRSQGIVVASTARTSSVTPDDNAYEETRDGLLLGFNVIREISEASDLLSPLKSTCLLIIRGLETTRVGLISCCIRVN
jgi:hypothetical protein